MRLSSPSHLVAVLLAGLSLAGSACAGGGDEAAGGEEVVADAAAPEEAAARAGLVVGEPMPSFELALLGGGTVSDASLRGRVTLIDFWATWCLPCVAEMPRLHAARERWGDELAILSVSFDHDVAKIAPFREAKWPMPWLNAFAEGGIESDVAHAFDVRALPKAVLIAADGTVLAVGQDLRGAALDSRLELALGPPPPSG